MYLKNLTLESYRNFDSKTLEFVPNTGLNIFVGDNGLGKTNVLESIYLLSYPRSFRTRHTESLIKIGNNHYLIEAEFDNFNSQTAVLEVFENQPQTQFLKLGAQINPSRKIYQRNKVDIDLKQFLSNLQTVLFSPEDLDLVTQSPKLRRRFLDLVLFEVDREYFQINIHYTRLLNQRNAILKNSPNLQTAIESLAIWDQSFVDTALQVFEYRNKLVQSLKTYLPECLERFLPEFPEQITLQYLPGNQNLVAVACTREYIQNQLVKNHTRDFKSKYTNFGPHRDDFKLLIHDQSVVEFCSRGQLRSLVLSLKLAQINYIETHTLKKPLLLLDDVFSELDKTRRKALLELALDYQTFISTVEMGYFEDLGVDFTLFKL